VITSIQTEKMIVISDLHLGNPFSKIRRQLLEFLRWAAKNKYDICINGDGLEIAQASFKKIAFEVPEFLRALGAIKNQGQNVYYVTGNHDIALEHFLEDWGVMKVTPFLNVESGNSRIRIEHGHIYDPFFVSYPVMYEVLTHFAGYLLKIHPALYKLWIGFEKWKSHLRAKRTGIVGEHPSFAEAAKELCRRGFDAVVFGHTHHPGMIQLENENYYFNSGSWMISSHYINIEKGKVELRHWTP
jgi:UDP-2,3-diacylglucosamine pyrophosphatase LpxH